MPRIEPDSNDILVWTLNETSGTTRINSGTLGSAGNLTNYGGIISDIPAIL